MSEQLEYVLASIHVIHHVRHKYSCGCCDSIVQTPALSRPIARDNVGLGLLAQVAVVKYAEHLPMYCRSTIYAREGVTLEQYTLADWIDQFCQLLRPLDDALNHYDITESKLRDDDTPVQVLSL